jgi:hypothetical protein
MLDRILFQERGVQTQQRRGTIPMYREFAIAQKLQSAISAAKSATFVLEFMQLIPPNDDISFQSCFYT